MEQLAPAEPERRAVAGTRVDHAHVKAGSPRPEEQPKPVPLPEPPSVSRAVEHHDGRAELRTQAGQLAAHLQARQEDLNRREADLNVRLAEFDVSLRGARLWQEERREELAERENGLTGRAKELTEREQRLEERLKRLAEAGVAYAAANREAEEAQRRFESHAVQREAELAELARRLQRQAETLAGAQAEFQDRRERIEKDLLVDRQQIACYRKESQEVVGLSLTRLEERRQAVEVEIAARRAAAIGPPPAPVVTVEANRWEERSRQLDERQERLERAEALLEAGQAELAALRRTFERRREQHEAEALAERRRLAEDVRRHETEWVAKKEALRRQSEQIDQRRAILEKTRSDLSQRHREALELRLATEELQAQLAGPMAPASLNRSLAVLHRRIADHYRLEMVELTERKAELDLLRNELTEQLECLKQRRSQWQSWLAERQAEIEQQSARLVAREQELDRQEAHYRGLEDSWREERRELQEEVRRLLAELRRGGGAGERETRIEPAGCI